jgi:hypothetical protein
MSSVGWRKNGRHGMSSKNKRTRRKRWATGTAIISCLLLLWWQLAGPATLFRVQIWLLERGAWGNIDYWIAHGNWYLPHLIEEADNLAPARGYLMRETRAEGAFEAYAHYKVDTVSDWVRLALGELTGVDDGAGLTLMDGTTYEQRLQAAHFWREWYRQHKDRLRWNSQRKMFEIVP